MKLIEIKYTDSNASNWQLLDLSLGNFNLIIGENAVGKSRTVHLISSFAQMIAKQDTYIYFGEWVLSFMKNNGDILTYELDVLHPNIQREKLSINGHDVLNRDKNSTKIYSETSKKFIKINPPDDTLVLHVRRDKDEFPFFEDLIQWAKQVRGFKFGSIAPHTLNVDKQTDTLTSIDNIPALLEQLNDSEYTAIINQFNSLNYELEKISIRKNLNGNRIIVYQKGMTTELNQHDMSQGMFRSLCLIIFMHYLQSKNNVSTIIVDDFCEGLDYNRAIKLGKLIVEQFANSKIQFIATTNDNFLMDVIDIKYWNILVREGSTVRSFNYQNSKAIFDDFKLSGLSNFYLFSSDFLSQKQAV